MGYNRFVNFVFAQYEFSDNMKAARKGRGLTQAEVAKILNVSKATISIWENGKGLPTIDNFLAVCWLFDFHPTSFLAIKTDVAVKTKRMFDADINAPVALSVEVFEGEPMLLGSAK